MSRFFGLDSHKAAVFATVLTPELGTIDQYEFPLDDQALRAFEEQLREDDHIAIEATTNTAFLYRRFRPRVAEVVVANPKKVGLIRDSRAKTDKNDSWILAVLLWLGLLPNIWVPDDETQEDREILGHRAGLVKEGTRIRNRIRALLTRNGLTCPSSDVASQDAHRFFDKITERLSWAGGVELASLLEQLDSVEKGIRKLDVVIERRAGRWEDLSLLLTIPGMGTMLAFTVLAIIGTITRFPTPASLANYGGTLPSNRASAGHTKHGPTGKAGSKMLRWAISEAVRSLVRQPGSFQKRYRRLRRRHGEGVAVVACGHKLLEVIWHMLTEGERFNEGTEAFRARKERRRAAKVQAAEKVSPPRPLEVIVQHLGRLQAMAGRRPSSAMIPPQLRTMPQFPVAPKAKLPPRASPPIVTTA